MTDFKAKSDRINDLHRRFYDQDAEQLRNDYRELLKTPAFRRVLANILKRAHVFGSISFDNVDTNTVMKAIGFRELGVDIYMTANQADGASVMKAIEERNAVERERKILLENETKGNEK